MNKIKTIFVQTILISFGILTAMTLEGIMYHIKGVDIYFEWYHLFSIIFAAFISSLPGLLFMNLDRKSKKGIICQLIIHGILVYAINMILGFLFHWYSNIQGFILISISYFIVYIFVWFGILLIGKQDANQINSALDSIRDEE